MLGRILATLGGLLVLALAPLIRSVWMRFGIYLLVLFNPMSWEMIVLGRTLRQNIYTDPQVPIQVKPDLYPVNNPGPDAPLLFTTNFSLTFFTVMSDLEKSKVPVWLQVVSCLFPARFMVTISRGVFLKGAGVAELWPELAALGVYAVVVIAVAIVLTSRRQR